MPRFRTLAPLLFACLPAHAAVAAPAGAPDPGFSGDGAATVAFDLDDDSLLDTVQAIATGPGGVTYLVGLANAPATPLFPDWGGSAIAIARLTHAGKPDVNYGTLGRVVHSDPSVAHLMMLDAALTADGQLLAAGYALAQTTRMAVCRFAVDGSIDGGFGDAGNPGCAFVELGDDYAVAHALQALPDGRIALGGENAAGDAIVVMLDANGARDAVFAGGEPRVVGSGVVADLALDANGALVAAGSFDGLDQRAFVAKFDAVTGEAIADFSGGVVAFDHGVPGGSDSFVAVSVAPDLRVLAAGWSENGGIARAVVVRFDTDGQPDADFGTAGARAFAPAQPTHRLWIDDVLASDADAIYISGRDVDWPGNSFDATAFALRLHPDGSDDTSYGDAGTARTTFAHIEPTDVHLVLQGDRITLATSVGDGPLPPLTADFGAFRFDHGQHTRHRVTPMAGPGGTLKPNATQTVAHGNVAMFFVAPKPGFVLAHIEGCGGAMSGNHYSAGPITADCSVKAIFAPKP